MSEFEGDLESKVMRPVVHTSRAFYFFAAGLISVIGLFLYAYSLQLIEGLSITGLDDVHIWGVYISNFIFFIGISHAGIAISATVHIMDLRSYRPIARMAELLTLVSLAMAGMSIVIDLGRPDRAFHLITYYLERFPTSPLVWDITAVATYLVLSSTYLYLSLREDISICRERCKGYRQRLYGLMLPWYSKNEKMTVHRLSWWMAVTILPVMVMVHTTVAWIFSVMSSRPLWFSAFAGPFYIVAAVASGIGIVIVIAALLRSLYHWERIIGENIFKGLGNFLSIVTLLYLYFMMGEQLGARYAGPTTEFLVSESWLYGDFAWIFWPMTIGGMLVPAVLLLIQALRRRSVNINMTAILALVVVAAFWVKRYLLIATTMTRGVEIGHAYYPTWVESSIILGTFAIPIFLYALFLKLFPIIELGVVHDMERDGPKP